MIRDVVIHVSNEQPLLADLFATPAASDAGLVCTNVRTVDGKRPIFIDRSESVFFFPYLHLRFIEISQAALAKHVAEGGDPATGADAASPWGAEPSTSRAMVPTEPEPGLPTEPDRDEEIEIDEGFLQRIRDI